MLEGSNAKKVHSQELKKNHKYDLAELESKRNEEAYKRFVTKPYYLEVTKNERGTGNCGQKLRKE